MDVSDEKYWGKVRELDSKYGPMLQSLAKMLKAGAQDDRSQRKYNYCIQLSRFLKSTPECPRHGSYKDLLVQERGLEQQYQRMVANQKAVAERSAAAVATAAGSSATSSSSSPASSSSSSSSSSVVPDRKAAFANAHHRSTKLSSSDPTALGTMLISQIVALQSDRLTVKRVHQVLDRLDQMPGGAPMEPTSVLRCAQPDLFPSTLPPFTTALNYMWLHDSNDPFSDTETKRLCARDELMNSNDVQVEPLVDVFSPSFVPTPVSLVSVEQYCCDVDFDNASQSSPAENILRGLDNLRSSPGMSTAAPVFSPASSTLASSPSVPASTLLLTSSPYHPLREPWTGVLQPHNVADYLAQSLDAMPELLVAHIQREPCFEARLCTRSPDSLITATIRLRRPRGHALLLDPGVTPLQLPPCGDDPHPVLRLSSDQDHIYTPLCSVDRTLRLYSRRLSFVAHLSDELYHLEKQGFRFAAEPDSLRVLLLLEHAAESALLLRCSLTHLPAAPPLKLRVPLQYPGRPPAATLWKGLSSQLRSSFAALLRQHSLHRSLSTLLHCYRDAICSEIDL